MQKLPVHIVKIFTQINIYKKSLRRDLNRRISVVKNFCLKMHIKR